MAELVREIMIDATPETIFPFLTVPEKHREWEGTEVELDPTPGGIYRVLVHGQYQAAGTFLEVVPNEKIVIAFGWEGMPDVPPGSTQVEFTLHREGDKTRLRMVHSGLPDENQVMMHTTGWDHYLGRLAVRAAGGDPGPDLGPGGDG